MYATNILYSLIILNAITLSILFYLTFKFFKLRKETNNLFTYSNSKSKYDLLKYSIGLSIPEGFNKIYVYEETDGSLNHCYSTLDRRRNHLEFTIDELISLRNSLFKRIMFLININR